MEIPDWVKYELLERWRKARRFVNKNPRAVWGITLASGFVLFLVLISILSRPGRPKLRVSNKAFFYDLNTGKLFVGRADKPGPVKAPSGPLPNGGFAGVRANVFTYVNEPNENDLVVGYLEKPDPNFVPPDDMVDKMLARSNDWGRGKLLRRLEDKEWVPGDSSRGKWIQQQAAKRDERGRIPRYYTPK